MKRISALLIALMMVWGFSLQAQAALTLRGTDTLGYQLIYDTDLDITWYDYSTPDGTWQNQVDWADALSVTFGSNTYADWRLPTTVDGVWVDGYDGNTTAGYNITSSEMGHLYYTELGNLGWQGTDGSESQSGWGLSDTGDFQNLIASYYWSGTEYSADTTDAWLFNFYTGYQGKDVKDATKRGLAVHSGNVVIPEPGTMLLLGTGLVGLAAWRKRR